MPLRHARLPVSPPGLDLDVINITSQGTSPLVVSPHTPLPRESRSAGIRVDPRQKLQARTLAESQGVHLGMSIACARGRDVAFEPERSTDPITKPRDVSGTRAEEARA